MGRKSKKKLPQYLHEKKGNYYYHNPKANIFNQSMGTDRYKACQAAFQLNAIMNPDIQSLVTKVLRPNSPTVSGAIKRFKEEIIPSRKLAQSSKKNMIYRLNRLEKDLGTRHLDEVDVKTVADYLDTNFSGDSYKQHRSLLSRVFSFAMTKGLCKFDPVEKTLPTRSSQRIEKVRQRLSKTEFDAIYEQAEPWLQVAMDIALITLQRRSDLVGLKYSDIKNGRLYLVQKKTEKHGDSARLSIKIGPWLAAVIKRSQDSGILSPLIIHRRPKRIRSRKKGGPHWTSVKPDYLSRAFAEARDRTGLFNHLESEEKPTFHEIRSLGGTLYQKAGWSEEKVQALMGHTSTEMTKEYLKGHNTWTEVEASLTK